MPQFRRLVCLLLLSCLLPLGYCKEIALTIDDLPFVGSTHNKAYKIKLENQRFKAIIDTLKKHNIPVVGFVIAGTIESGQWQLLEEFHQAGFIIANHTHNHLNLNQTSAERYINNIQQADLTLAPLLPDKKFFRYPYLAEGRGQRKERVAEFLVQANYIVAPVTIDSKDFRFNQALYAIPYRVRKYKNNLGALKRRYLSYIWRQTLRAEKIAARKTAAPTKQILLLHANLINSLFLDDIILMYKRKGYRFISLEDALKAPAPTIATCCQYDDPAILKGQGSKPLTFIQ